MINYRRATHWDIVQIRAQFFLFFLNLVGNSDVGFSVFDTVSFMVKLSTIHRLTMSGHPPLSRQVNFIAN